MADYTGALFIAYFDKPISEDDLSRAGPLFETYKLSEDVIILYSRNPTRSTVPSDLFDFDDDKPGVVFRLNGSWAGHYYEDSGEWLKDD